MRYILTRIIFSILILVCLTAVVSANPLRSWEHGFNPALLGVRSRTVMELGISTDVMFSNSAFGINDIFTEEIVIDFNEIAEDLNGGSLFMRSDLAAETHFVLTMFGLSLGVYVEADGIASLGVPGEFIDLLANGNPINGTSSGSEDVYARIFMGAGIFAGYRWKDFQFGAKVGVFSPLFYTDSSASYDYSLTTDTGTGEITATAGMNVPFYSAVDFNSINIEDIKNGLNGINLSVGAVKVKKNKAMYGVSITGITLKPAEAKYRTLLSNEVSVSIDNLLDNAIDGNEDWLTEELTDFTFETLDEGNYEVSMPLQIGGFYRLAGFPKFIDWIAHAQVTFDDEVQLRAGVIAEGAISPLSMLSIGLEYNRIFWSAAAGLRANLRVFELGINVGLTAPEIKHLFNANGLFGKVYVAFGF